MIGALRKANREQEKHEAKRTPLLHAFLSFAVIPFTTKLAL